METGTIGAMLVAFSVGSVWVAIVIVFLKRDKE
jgi:hypothetical protein